jgi:hypothetical protein
MQANLIAMDSVALLRHTLATLAYRTLRAVHPAPPGFAEFRAAAGSRSAGEVLAHMCDLLDWAARSLTGDKSWQEIPPAEWDADKDRFFAALTQLDQALQQKDVTVPDDLSQRLFQGPIADALTHVGQLTQLRRLAGAPVKPENYFVADVIPGRTTSIQPPPKRTF